MTTTSLIGSILFMTGAFFVVLSTEAFVLYLGVRRLKSREAKYDPRRT